ncbi:MAG: hypothetical protein ABI862_08425 [Ilumatobacteraceae bacterium]
MRTTLVIDDDVLAAARELAEYRGVAIGKVISELSRKGIEVANRPTRKHGRVPTFSPRKGAPPITSEAVLNALDES